MPEQKTDPNAVVEVLNVLAGRASGMVTQTEIRDAARTILDILDAETREADAFYRNRNLWQARTEAAEAKLARIAKLCDETDTETYEAAHGLANALEAQQAKITALEGKLAEAWRVVAGQTRLERDRAEAAEAKITAALTHDPLHGADSGMHCGGMAPCIRRILSDAPTPLESKPEAFKQTGEDLNQEPVQGDTKLLQNSEPSDTDEREALARVIFLQQYPNSEGAWDAPGDLGKALWYQRADVILAAGWRRQGQITEAMVAAALEAWESKLYRDTAMRAALEAAEEARRG
jgi:hypothetical protein